MTQADHFQYTSIPPSYFCTFLQHSGPKEGGGGKGGQVSRGTSRISYLPQGESSEFSQVLPRPMIDKNFHGGQWLVGISPTEPCDCSELSVTRTRTEFLRRPLVPKGKAGLPPRKICPHMTDFSSLRQKALRKAKKRQYILLLYRCVDASKGSYSLAESKNKDHVSCLSWLASRLLSEFPQISEPI